ATHSGPRSGPPPPAAPAGPRTTLPDHAPRRRQEPLTALVLDAHHIVRAGAEEFLHPPQDLAPGVHHFEADHVGLVELVLGGLRELRALQRHLGAAVLLRRLRAAAALDARHHVPAVPPPPPPATLFGPPRRPPPPRGNLQGLGANPPPLPAPLPPPGPHPPPHPPQLGWRTQPDRRYFAAAS